MNNQLLLDNFLETVLEPDKETINYYGVEVPFPSLAQVELNHQFNLNLNNNISPDIFESIIEKVAIGAGAILSKLGSIIIKKDGVEAVIWIDWI